METQTKPVNKVAVGDVVESAEMDGTRYLTVTEPIEMDHAVTASGTDSWFVLTGEDQNGDPLELYIHPGVTVDVVARPYRVVETHIYNAVWATSEDEACRRAATEQLDWDDHDLDAGPSNPDEV